MCWASQIGRNKPILQKTKLGWVVSGIIPIVNNPANKSNCLFAHITNLNNLIENFWKIEENYSDNNNYCKEGLECEKDFIQNHKRDAEGRFTVTLPVKDNYTKLGDSLETAVSRFHSLEHKLNKNEPLKKNYVTYSFKTYVSVNIRRNNF